MRCGGPRTRAKLDRHSPCVRERRGRMTEKSSSWEALIEGNSPAMRELRKAIAEAARAPNDPVLIVGASGSGKERVAQAIHLSSRPVRSPYVPHVGVNHTPELFDSSLFGHLRGAFTGANAAMKGACDAAGHGVLFLDEVGDIPLGLQPKLLRVIESRKYRPIGGTKDRILNARVVAATHVDLEEAVERGTFRKDLYYRLAHFAIRVPALDERREDIPGLVRTFARDRGDEEAFDAGALDALAARSYPGQVRELMATVHRLMAQHTDRPIRANKVPRDTRRTPREGHSRISLALRETQPSWAEYVRAGDAYVLEVLAQTGGNVAAAARHLGESREWLRKKAKRLRKP